MSKHRRVDTWGKVRKACRDKGVTIDDRGSEARLEKVLPNGKKRVHILSHNCCRSKNSIVHAEHLSAIKRKFGLSDEDF